MRLTASDATQLINEKLPYPQRDIWVLLAFGLATRLLFIPFNSAEYTDGVIQVRQFVEPGAIWPPLYTALVYPLKFLLGYLWAGRLVSALAGALAVYPLYRIARRAFGTRAALYAGIFYLTAPVAIRWAPRMMSDMTFSLFFWWACERFYFASDERDETSARKALSWGSLCMVLSVLTRYQGLLLLGPFLVCFGIVWKRFGHFPWRSVMWLAGLLFIPVWIAVAGNFIHADQFADRALTGGPEKAFDPWLTLKVLALNGEAFALLTPYFLTYPVFVWALVGMFWVRMRRGPFFAWQTVWVAVVLLVAQSAFSSFQERYFLPLYGFFYVLAGAGLYAVGERWRKGHYKPIRQRLFPYLLIGTFAFSTFFGITVLLLQRGAFGDLAAASRLAGEMVPRTEEGEPAATIYTNEMYRPEPLIAANKVSFFSKLPTEYLDLSHLPRPNGQPPILPLNPGDLIVLCDPYGREEMEAVLAQSYELEHLGTFQRTLLPLFPDIMDTRGIHPLTNQNPMAWIFRYEWQVFQSDLWRVRSVRQVPETGLNLPPAFRPAPRTPAP